MDILIKIVLGVVGAVMACGLILLICVTGAVLNAAISGDVRSTAKQCECTK